MKERLDLSVEGTEIWQIVNDIDENDEATERVHRTIEICSIVFRKCAKSLFENKDPNSVYLAEQLERMSEEVHMVSTAMGVKKMSDNKQKWRF